MFLRNANFHIRRARQPHTTRFHYYRREYLYMHILRDANFFNCDNFTNYPKCDGEGGGDTNLCVVSILARQIPARLDHGVVGCSL